MDLELRRWSRHLRGAPVWWVAVLLVVALGLWLRGASFYPLPLSARIDHPDYALLSPSRRTGLTYGGVALGLMLLNLTYLLRRRFPHLPLGRMRIWLEAHVVSGMVAALFVAFHSAFQLRSPAAMLMASALGLTTFTGLVGRFFYALAPSESRLSTRIADLEALTPGVTEPLEEALRKAVPRPVASASLWGVARALPALLRLARTRRLWVLAMCRCRMAHAAELERSYAEPLAREVARLAAREVHAVIGRELLRVWRPWHRLCALVTVAGVLLHAGVAIFYGYGWNVAP